MKEKIVINQDWLVKDMKAGVPELDKLFICQKVEKIPENFRELKEMCINLKNEDLIIFNNNVRYSKTNCVVLIFDSDGSIYDIERNFLAKNLTPEKQWNIIKSLIGKE